MFKIGIGYDIHRLAPGKKLILGGIEVPSERGPLAHSDGDVILHALADALLGAAGLGDIGKYFPPSDERYRGIESKKILIKVKSLLDEANYSIVNIDTVLILEHPKIEQFKSLMQKNIAEILEVTSERINLKATTNEKVNALGRGEALAAYAVVLIERNV